jgi:polyhydroxyalkanoate synthase
MGHSLGGTLAAIYGTWAPETISGLVLLSTPLCFAANESQFRDTLVTLVPGTLSHADPFPGSLLSHMSAIAAPGTFFWSRLVDAAFSLTDSRAMDVHARVERWALDEMALPGKLVHQIVDWLYRDNRLCRGALEVKGRLVGPRLLSIPALAVVNTADEVAPPASMTPFVEAMPEKLGRILQYSGEGGVCLQHLAVLVGRQAYAEIWPAIISWLHTHRAITTPSSDVRYAS